jgi:hypothetical protein
MTVFPACATCARFNANDKTKDTCEAFPEGIPAQIWEGQNDHRFPVKGDRGLTYKEE